MTQELIEQCIKHCHDIRLLYVEDNREIRESTLEMFKRFFQHIQTAEDGVEGVKKFQEDEFDLVLTDINMPVMNGLEMIKNIREINPSVTVIVLSAHNETDYFLESIKLNVDAFILKPINVMQLMESLIKFVEKINLKREVAEYQIKLLENNKELENIVQRRTAALEYQLNHDDLTGLWNHRAMMNDTTEQNKNILFLIDINGFQNFNDLYGLEAGNFILKKIADILNTFNIEQKYGLYRVYGDGFVLYHIFNENDKLLFKEQKDLLVDCLSGLKIHLELLNEEITIELNIGASLNEKKPFETAERALHYAKEKNQIFTLYTDNLDNSKKILQDLYWKKQIIQAISEDNIIPVFQAIVDNNQEVIKYESLIRLIQHENGEEKIITPFYFLDAAINTQQYDKLTKIMIQKVFEKMKNETVSFSINLSFEDFSNPEQIKFLEHSILKYGVGDRLVVEVLETEILSDYELVIQQINSLKKYGVRVAIDDFGSGFSNFEHILKLNPDYIKIDSSHIKNILTDEKSYTLVKAIAEFSKELGIKVIAEFVSSKEIFEALQDFSIDEYQGYYFSIPSQDLK